MCGTFMTLCTCTFFPLPLIDTSHLSSPLRVVARQTLSQSIVPPLPPAVEPDCCLAHPLPPQQPSRKNRPPTGLLRSFVARLFLFFCFCFCRTLFWLSIVGDT
jgi:hypothetical protein